MVEYSWWLERTEHEEEIFKKRTSINEKIR